ncbi:UBP-type zinc finger domain-containing protein [soil metagenome]
MFGPVRQRRGARSSSAPAMCAHLSGATGVGPPVPVSALCEDCAGDGTAIWAHLRMCLTCGHVGCCDSSPQRHATAHHEATGHPVMRSIEPGETWRWCYVDLELKA